MAWNGIPVVDGDGHVMEDWDSLLQYMPEPYLKSGRFRDESFRLWITFIPQVFSSWSPAPSGKLEWTAGWNSWTM